MPPTIVERPVVRLYIEIYLHHLAPAPRSQDVEDVRHIVPPPVGMDSAGHHSAIDEVEMVLWKRRANLLVGQATEGLPARVSGYVTGYSSHPPGETSSVGRRPAPFPGRYRFRKPGEREEKGG